MDKSKTFDVYKLPLGQWISKKINKNSHTVAMGGVGNVSIELNSKLLEFGSIGFIRVQIRLIC